MLKAACQCCGCYTVSEAYDICPVCFWEQDPKAAAVPAEIGGANRLSLFEARGNYRCWGACEKRFAAKVRRPRWDELPSSQPQ